MKKRVQVLILELLKLKAEYSPSEFQDALDHINEDYLQLSTQSKSSSRTSEPREKTAEFKLDLSRYVDPKDSRYRKLDRLIYAIENSKSIKLEDIRKLGEELDKNFESGKSKRDTLPRLIKTISSLDYNKASNLIDTFLEKTERKDSQYSRLADFLIGGGQGKNSR